MPASSDKQRRMFCAALDDDELLNELGVSREVAKEFCREDIESVKPGADQDDESEETEDDEEEEDRDG